MSESDKRKGAGNDLIWVAFFCFIAGFVSFLFAACIYWYWDGLRSFPDDDPVSASIYAHNLAITGILAFGVLPIMGLAFFGIGFKIWQLTRPTKLNQ